jgi:hypothetical protein
VPEIQNPEVVRNIEKRYGLKGYPGPGNISPEIVPVTLVDDITTSEDLDLHPFQGNLTAAAGGAGTFASTQLWNPASSGKIVTLEKILVFSSSGGTFYFRINLAGTLTTVSANKQARDSRSSTLPSANIRSEALGAVFTPTMTIVQGSGGTYELEWHVILDEDASVYCQTSSANDAFVTTFFWTERPRTVEDGDIP